MRIILITGGQRSGKSAKAEAMALQLSANPVYVATAHVWDEEFRERVTAHQQRRGPQWTNIEEEMNLSRHDPTGRVVVIDCITLWLTNFFFHLGSDAKAALQAAKSEFDRFTSHDATFIFVTNEIGMGGTSDNALQRHFTDLQGWMNQYVAAKADDVILMVSGVQLTIKSRQAPHTEEHSEAPDAKPLAPIMLAGTGSDVGKSILATALCRIFVQDGLHPAPFKAQNMALNSYATPDGLEIGRAQAVQAEAAGLPCHTDMNPLLLKPQSDHTSQVVLHGKPIGCRDAYSFWRRDTQGSTADTDNTDFRKEVCMAFDRLAARYNPIVMEGAGSISELNLRDHDIVNLPMAQHAGAKVILVGDIDRGGVFASVYGSIALLKPEERRLIKGIIINKFRGDLRLFDEGRRMLQDICQVPVLGVVPYVNDLHIEGEDSVALAGKNHTAGGALTVNVAVVELPHISNYTDFDALERDERVHLYYCRTQEGLRQADIIVLPGTKSTIDSMRWLRQCGMAQAVTEAHSRGATVLGICGGYQMMGVEVRDPEHVEGDEPSIEGLALLPVTTTMQGEKVTRQVTCEWGTAYEIHQGVTTPLPTAKGKHLATLDDGRHDGYMESDTCMGTYLHGILDNRKFVDFLLKPFADRIDSTTDTTDYQTLKEQEYDRLADHVRKHIDMDRLYQIMRGDD